MSPASPGTTLGIVGTGVGLRTHLWGAPLLRGTTVVGVVGRTPERAASHLAERGADPGLACTLEELVARRPTVLAVTTPPEVTADHLRHLGSYDGRLLVEKPVLAEPPSSLDTVVDFQLRGHPLVTALRARLATGVLGPLSGVWVSEHSGGGAAEVVGWAAREDAGGGQAHAMGSHLVDLAAFLAGAAYSGLTEVTSRHLRLDARSRVTDTLRWRARAADGPTLGVLTSCVLPHPRGLRVRVEGARGSAYLQHSGGEGSLVVDGDVTELLGLRDVVAAQPDVDPAVCEEPSPFRLAYPFHLRDAVLARDGVGASGHDGHLNARALAATG